MIDSKHLATIYAIHGLPSNYASTTWDSIDITEPEVNRITNAVSNYVPSTLFIQGNAAPIVNQLWSSNKHIRGININERLANPFGEHVNPKADVILIHSIGKYTGKYEIAHTTLSNIINHYSKLDTLIILQSDETFTFLKDNWGISVVNKLRMLSKKERAWI